jgi:CRP-like cAMP-binding protein
VEHTWAGDWDSGLRQTPSRYCIDALEPSQLLLIDCTRVQELVRRVPLVAELLRINDERNAIAAQKRLHEAIACPAEERYAAFLAQHPSYAQRFSQLTIASYLGMSPEALSRIRAKLPPARTPAYS